MSLFVQYMRFRVVILSTVLALTAAFALTHTPQAFADARKSTCNELLSPLFMDDEYVGEDDPTVGTVTYITDAKERREYRWKIQNGKFVHALTGEPVTTNDIHKTTRPTYDRISRVEFVISPNFHIYGFTESQQEALSKRILDIHHSTLLAGQPVGFAGEVEILNGELLQFTNRSGHYLPDEVATIEAIRLLKRRGLSFKKTQFHIENLEHLLSDSEYRRFLLLLMPEQILQKEAESMLERGGYDSYAPPRAGVLNRLRARVSAERSKLNGASPLLERFRLIYSQLPVDLKRFVDGLNTAP